MKARSRPLAEVYDGPLDLNDVAASDGVLFVRDGVGLAGRGVVARVPPADAPDLLGSITHDGPSDLPGVGPVALGSVPFRPGDPATLIVPATVVSKTPDGAVWVTEIEPDDREVPPRDRIDADWTPPTTSSIEAGSYRIEPIVPVERYLSAVAAIRDAVRAGELVKAVIARDIAISTDVPIDVHAVLRRLKASFGSSYRFSVDGFIGASPELLVAVDDDVVRSHPLAGTAPRTGDVDHDADIAARLIESTKDQIEHRVVIDVVHDTLLPWCSYLDWEPEPSIVTVANVQHLGTAIEGRLSQPRPNVLELVTALSPTPALGGHPRADALALIEKVEGVERGPYGGAVGWVDAAGNGTWAVAIRCAELTPDRRSARLVAGGGIVADSDPAAELAETQAKFQAMLSAIVRA
jgi:menaquinone-specific isochorismate synthase